MGQHCVPVAAAALLLFARHRGLDWVELGLSPRHWRKGARYALAVVAPVLAVIAIGVALPISRQFFLTDRHTTMSGALIAAMVVIPLHTVIPEELAFRGVLHARLDRICAPRGVFVAGSVLFGLWHIASSLGPTTGNRGLNDLLGGGPAGLVLGVLLAMLATAMAGLLLTLLRRRSGSLLAPIALHWSVNGAGALAAALVWHLAP